MGKVREEIEGRATELISELGGALKKQIKDSGPRLDSIISDRIASMVKKVNESIDSKGRFVGVNDDDVLTYVPDRRNFNFVGPVLIGLMILIMLPGWAKSLALVAFVYAAIKLVIGYVLHSKVDIPEGYEGVACKFGKPLQDRPHRGRNWIFSIQRSIPYLVSTRDQVVDSFNANFTGDYVTVGLSEQFAFRVSEPGKFVSVTTPSGSMKLLSLYASYTSLRMITSIGDARVKFTGRDNLENVIGALNAYLSELLGIQVFRANMPQAENSVLDDLEKIRTNLKAIDSLQQTRTVKLEAAIKAVEQTIRQLRVESRNEALELQQTAIKLETHLGEAVSKEQQEILMNARQSVENRLSELRNSIAQLRANVARSKALAESLEGLKASWQLRTAMLKGRTMAKLMPKELKVINVDGIGAGVGISAGNQLFREVLRAPDPVESKPAA